MPAIQQYYWDACLFLEHLREETVAPDKKRALINLLQQNKDRQNKIFTSVITHVEVLPKKLTASDIAKEEIYWSYFNEIWFIDQEVTRPILHLARQIKDYYYQEADPKAGEHYRMMSTGDAIHLATAIAWRADEFHTRDKKQTRWQYSSYWSTGVIGKRKNSWPLGINDRQPI
jgi:predicted nucleic acid-binding protein